MPYMNHAPSHLPAATGTALVVVALVLGCMAPPARSADAPAKPATDAIAGVKAPPPSVQVDAATEKKTDDTTAPASEAKHRNSVRIRAFPPSVQVDRTTESAKDDTAAPAGEVKHGKSRNDEDFDTFTRSVEKMPWVIGLVFLVVGSIFLTPVVLLIGIIWYKLRKTRLQNEAMLALAAKGVVSPAQAADALAAGASPASAAPQVYQEVLAQRKRVVWSDLRKGVILAMAGLAFLVYAITAEGEPSWVGLILLFVGGGYIVLWRLEGRHLEQASATRPGAGTSGGG